MIFYNPSLQVSPDVTGRDLAAIQVQRAVRGWRARVWAVKVVHDRAWKALLLVQVRIFVMPLVEELRGVFFSVTPLLLYLSTNHNRRRNIWRSTYIVCCTAVLLYVVCRYGVIIDPPKHTRGRNGMIKMDDYQQLRVFIAHRTYIQILTHLQYVLPLYCSNQVSWLSLLREFDPTSQKYSSPPPLPSIHAYVHCHTTPSSGYRVEATECD